MMPGRRIAQLGALLAVTLALAAAAACHDNVGVGACFDSATTWYAYWLNSDTSLVFHWPASYMPIRVYAEPSGDLPADVSNAMSVWQGAFRCHELSYTIVTDSTHADIIVRNPVNVPAVARPEIRALHADSVSACTGVTQFSLDSAGTALAGPMRSYVSPLPGNDSASVHSCYHFVVAHELGHALGLLAESPDSGDIMYPTPTRLALSEADRYTIQILYHAPSKLGPPPRP